MKWNNAAEFSMPMPKDEQARLTDLQSYKVLDTPPEADFDHLAQLASLICETPIALVSLVDAHRQWFKSKVGVNQSETSREHAFCAHAILQPGLFIIPDATKDARFASNPLVVSAHIRFYAGAPLISPDHHVLGTLCVLDRVPRDLTEKQAKGLRLLSKLIMSHLVQRRELIERREEALMLKKAVRHLEKAKDAAESATRLRAELMERLGEKTQTAVGTLTNLNQQVLEHEVTKENRRNLRKAQSEADRLLAVSAELVNLAKMDIRRA